MTTPETGEKPFITLKKITLRVRDRFVLCGTSWEIRTGQNWALVGANGTGKTSLVRALTGDVPVVRGTMERHYPEPHNHIIGYVSFEHHRDFIASEENRDAARFFSKSFDDQKKAGQIILSAKRTGSNGRRSLHRIAALLEIDDLLDRGIRDLSTGEMRKVLIARALIKSPRLLVLDEPFDGLDPRSRRRLSKIIVTMMDGGMQLVLVTHRQDEILPGISHVMHLGTDGAAISKRADEWFKAKRIQRADLLPGLEKASGLLKNPEPVQDNDTIPDDLVEMKNVTIRYGKVRALQNLNWTMKHGENWAIVGPNGSGKTTLLRLIFADIPQAYANEIYLFGKRRGTGESIWEIRRQIGIVGSEFQIHYRKSITAFEVVLSGFFDSVGLYRYSSPYQDETARRWISILGITDLAERPFSRLSYGEQRMILIARAVVKSPVLLLLDEPCQGLDPDHRHMVLELIAFIGTHTATHIVYVTHHEDEILPCFNQVLRM